MNISFLARAAKRCQNYGAYSTLVGGLNGYKKFYPVSYKTMNIQYDELSSYIDSTFKSLGKRLCSNLTQNIKEIVYFSDSSYVTFNAFIAFNQKDSNNKANSKVNAFAITMTTKENNTRLAINETRYSITHASMRNKYTQNEWSDILVTSKNPEEGIFHAYNLRGSFNRNSFINVLSKVYAPVYFDVFKLTNNFSQNMNEYLLKEANTPQKNSHRISKRSRITPMRG